MVDLREKVVQDRGIIAKIQGFIPGFSGYRAKEDIRAADNMLRIQIAGRIAAIRADLEGCRAVMTDNGQFQGLDRVGSLVNKMKAIEGNVRHAPQGYSGIGARIKVGEAELNKLYEYDLALLTSLADLGAEVTAIKGLASAGGDVNGGLAKAGVTLNGFEAAFKKRMDAVTGTEV